MKFLFVITTMLCLAFLLGRGSVRINNSQDFKRVDDARARAVLDLQTCESVSRERLNYIRSREQEYVDKWNQREKAFLQVFDSIGPVTRKSTVVPDVSAERLGEHKK